MYSIMLVDDEEPALQRFGKLIREHTDFRVAAMCCRASEALTAAAATRPDVAFLDIEMPGINGLELAERLTELCPEMEIVFVTAFSEYALQAFRTNAIDYLIKPVRQDDIAACARKLQRRIASVAAAPMPAAAGDNGRIEALGGFALYAPGSARPLRFPTAKSEELLAYLLVNPDVNAAKWDLCEIIWPELEPEKAESNLHTSMYRLKKTLAEHRVPIRIDSMRGAYRLSASCRVDFWEQERLAAGRDGWSESGAAEAEACLASYRGPLFAGKTYAWSEPMRQRLERQFALFSKKLADDYFAAGRDDRAIALLQALTAAAPWDEEGYERLLGAYERRNERTLFLQLYWKMEHMFRSELGLEPGPAVRELYRKMAGQL
ncbi:MAG: response regulator [Paenibacillaceae bacterium]|nr:response regulator [Paenibacillaceae bacterium]